MTLLSALGGGLWIIPLGFVIAAIVSFYKAIKQWKSGSILTEMPRDGGPVKRTESDKRVSLYSIGAFWFGVIFSALAVGSFILMQLDK